MQEISPKLPLWMVLLFGSVAGLAISAACGGCADNLPPAPDAALAYSAHDQVTSCDRRWSADGTPPAFCDYACAVRPVELPCADLARPCNHVDLGCRAASGDRAALHTCAATFDRDGRRGCCDLRPVPSAPAIPTFYECVP